MYNKHNGIGLKVKKKTNKNNPYLKRHTTAERIIKYVLVLLRTVLGRGRQTFYFTTAGNISRGSDGSACPGPRDRIPPAPCPSLETP